MRIIQEVDEKITYKPLLGSDPRPTFSEIIGLAKKLEKNIEVIWNGVLITISPDSDIFTVMREFRKRY